MENAVNAFKTAFAVFIFVFALYLAFNVVGQARRTSDTVLAMTDKKNDYEYVEESDNNSSENERIVGFETILPVIYRYAKEQFAVTIVKSDGTPIVRYDLYTEGFMANWNTILRRKDEGAARETAQYLEVKDRIGKVDRVLENRFNLGTNRIWNAIGNLGGGYNPSTDTLTRTSPYLYAGKSDNSLVNIVSPWIGNPNLDCIQRIKADFTRDGVYVKDGVTYYGKDLWQYKDRAFKEVFLEVQTSGSTIVETDDNNVQYSLETIIGNKKLEIIYIMQN